MHTRQTGLVLAVLLGAMYATSAWGDEKRRQGEGGLWRNWWQWIPEGTSQPQDDCYHEYEASGVMTFDGPTPPDLYTCASLTVRSGGFPARGFIIAGPEAFRTGFFVNYGSEEYTVTLRPGTEVYVGAGIYGGNWTLEDGAFLGIGDGAANLDHDAWVI